MSEQSIEKLYEVLYDHFPNNSHWPTYKAHVRALALAVHDDACIECHNVDMRARCPRRRRIEALR